MQLLTAVPLSLEVSLFPDLLWSVAVLLPQLLDHGASERSSPLTLRLSLFSVRISHVSIFTNDISLMSGESALNLHSNLQLQVIENVKLTKFTIKKESKATIVHWSNLRWDISSSTRGRRLLGLLLSVRLLRFTQLV